MTVEAYKQHAHQTGSLPLHNLLLKLKDHHILLVVVGAVSLAAALSQDLLDSVAPAVAGIGVPYPLSERGMSEVDPGLGTIMAIGRCSDWGMLSAAFVPAAMQDNIPSYYH